MSPAQPELRRLSLLLVAFAAGLAIASTNIKAVAREASGERHLLYVVTPGIRDLLEFGGAGILVFDMDKDHQFIKRIETPASREAKPNNIKGVCACAATGKLYFTTTKRLACVDLMSEKTLWDKALPQGCDRMSITPDGKTLYVPSFEKDTWNVVDAASGDVIATDRDEKRGSQHGVRSRRFADVPCGPPFAPALGRRYPHA